MIIEAKSINSYYGKIQALFDVSFCLNDGEVISFIGANGAGKSTLMQSIVGLVKVGSGNIIFNLFFNKSWLLYYPILIILYYT